MKNGDWRIDKSPSQRNENRRKLFAEVRERAIRLLGETCCWCGYADMRALQIDHIEANAKEDRAKTGTSYYYNIIKKIQSGSTEYQILCANCNVIKRRENQECPLQNKDGPNPHLNETIGGQAMAEA